MSLGSWKPEHSRGCGMSKCLCAFRVQSFYSTAPPKSPQGRQTFLKQFQTAGLSEWLSTAVWQLHRRRKSPQIPLHCPDLAAELGVQSLSSVNLENLTKGTLIGACFSLFLSFPMTHNNHYSHRPARGALLSACSHCGASLPHGLLPTPVLIGL